MALVTNSKILLNNLVKFPSSYKCKRNLYLFKSQVLIQKRRDIHNVKSNSTVFEIVHGVGGTEAMLFADEMFGIYCKFFNHMKWSYRINESDKDHSSGKTLTKVIITEANSFENLIQEAGVHRVQRVPSTDKYGRMHTSTISIAVTPESVLDYNISEKDVELKSKRSSGPGGQHVNKTESAIRLTHRPTGIFVDCQESRHQADNRKIGMVKLVDKLRQIELEKLSSQVTNLKKIQIGSANRNEKIRTYNFPQDRITDHRINKSYHNLRALFSGDVSILEKIIKDFHK